MKWPILVLVIFLCGCAQIMPLLEKGCHVGCDTISAAGKEKVDLEK